MTAAVTSLETGEPESRDLTLQTAAERVARQFGRVFNAQVLWLESLDELAPVDTEPPAQRKLCCEQEL